MMLVPASSSKRVAEVPSPRREVAASMLGLSTAYFLPDSLRSADHELFDGNYSPTRLEVVSFTSGRLDML